MLVEIDGVEYFLVLLGRVGEQRKQPTVVRDDRRVGRVSSGTVTELALSVMRAEVADFAEVAT